MEKETETGLGEPLCLRVRVGFEHFLIAPGSEVGVGGPYVEGMVYLVLQITRKKAKKHMLLDSGVGVAYFFLRCGL